MTVRPSDESADRTDTDVWVRRGGALVVAAVAAYASYQHQRLFAVRGGADMTSAALWPLSVDGLLVLATAGLLAPRDRVGRRVRLAGGMAFGLGIAVSLAANIASAPTLTWQPVLVAGWPPVALLLAVELLAHRRRRDHAEIVTGAESANESADGALASVDVDTPPDDEPDLSGRRLAEDRMWQHYLAETARGRTPTGAELDRVAGTNNWGRAVLRKWRQSGRIPAVPAGAVGNQADRRPTHDGAVTR